MASPNRLSPVGEDGEMHPAFWQDTVKKQSAQTISWVERLYRTRLAQWTGSPGMFILLAAGVYFSGLLVAAALNSTSGYVKSPAIWLEAFGIPMVITGVYYLARAAHRMTADLGRIAESPEEYHSYTAYWKRKMAGIEITVIALLGTVLFTVGIVGAVNIAFDIGEGAFREGMMSPDMLRYSYQMILHGYMILLIGIALSELFKLVFGNIMLMRALFALPVKNDAEAVTRHTRSIINMSFTGAVIWTLAAVLFGILLSDTVSQGVAVAIFVLMLPPIALMMIALLLVYRLRGQSGMVMFVPLLLIPVFLQLAMRSPMLSLPVQNLIQSFMGM